MAIIFWIGIQMNAYLVSFVFIIGTRLSAKLAQTEYCTIGKQLIILLQFLHETCSADTKNSCLCSLLINSPTVAMWWTLLFIVIVITIKSILSFESQLKFGCWSGQQICSRVDIYYEFCSLTWHTKARGSELFFWENCMILASDSFVTISK